MLGTCLFCLFQTGALAAGTPQSLSGEALLFTDNTQTSTPSLAENLNAITPAAGDASMVVTAPVETDALVSDDAPVDLLADRVEYDEPAGIVSAIGNVELVQSGRILRAESVSYSLNEDKVTANGNVVLNEVTGETYFADNVELKDEMKNGFVVGLNGVLADGARFTASEAQKVADIKVVMRKASYTACEPCKADPTRAPIWQIKAGKVTHHKDDQRISYNNATFEALGVPVLYTPYFSHPDGTVDRKSGFLNPKVGFESDLGFFYQQDYYLDIAPDKDATIGAMIMTDEAPLVTGEYRQRFENAEITLSGGATYSSRIDRVGDNSVFVDNEERGHFFAEGLWDINDKWRAGMDLALVSDEQYLRQYNISNEDVLENTLYLERFSGRDYGTARLIRFKDMRVSDRRVEDQPNVLPEIYSRFLGDPNALLGGRWSFEASALGLQREGNEQDLARGTLEAGWQRRHVSNFGLVNTLDLNLRGDAYRANDRDISGGNSGRSRDASAVRGLAQAHLKTSLPFAKDIGTAQMVIEPITSITIGTDVDNDSQDVPNEDSQDVFLDATNIFNDNRFPGFDRIEDRSRATYGLQTGLYGDNGYQGEVFVGQSFRFDNDDNPFPVGSGLSEEKSDLVGNVSVRAGNALQLDYGLQLDSDNLNSQRHEVNMKSKIGPVSFDTRYFYINALQGTDFDVSREQIRNGLRYDFNDQWSVFGQTQYDLAQDTEGLRRLSYGLDYEGQCINFSIAGRRTLTNDSSGDNGTAIVMRLGLKNLGEFETSGLSFGADD